MALAIDPRAPARISALLLAAVLFAPTSSGAEEPSPPPNVTAEDLAKDNQLFLTMAANALHWDEPAEPVRIAGPIHFVGTRGLGSYLIVTKDGNVLLNTGTPASGPLIAASIEKLGFRVEDVKLILNGHAHMDHAGAFAWMKQRSGATVAIMREDVQAIRDGGKDDFHYGDDWKVMGFPPCAVDRVLRDGDEIRMGDVVLTALHTPGHTRGATTWVANVVDAGRALVVVWPDGGGFNPGYRLAKNPSYPGIGDDYRRTHHRWEMLRPDVFLGAHTDWFDLEAKRKRAVTEGVSAWIDPEGYRRFVAAKKRAFEDQVDREMGVPVAARK